MPIFGILRLFVKTTAYKILIYPSGSRSAIINNNPIMEKSSDRVNCFSAGPAKRIMICLSAVSSHLQPLPAHALLPVGELPPQGKSMGETRSEMD